MSTLKSARFFVCQSCEDQERDLRASFYSATCKVLDRETVVDGHFATMAENMKYLDAWNKAKELNQNS
jgi:hypothetical protein